MEALGERHLADRTFAEVRRAIQALSARYVSSPQRREPARYLDGAGKRAAFALYFAPLHFLTLRHLVVALRACAPPPASIVDLGCGTGAAGAAWSLGCEDTPRIAGVDRHPWAVEEAGWTYARLRVDGQATRGDLTRRRLPGRGAAILAAWAANELAAPARESLRHALLAAGARGARVLVVEPIARPITPWWDDWASAFVAAGGRADVWRFAVELPEPLRALDRAAGLDHRELTCRSLYLDGR